MSSLDTSNNLFTLAEFKDFIGVLSTYTTEDTKFEDYINASSWYLKQAFDRPIKAQSLTEYHDGTGQNQIFTRAYPIMCVITLYSDADRTFASTNLLSSSTYQTYTDEGMIILTDDVFDIGERVIKLTYRAGWDTIPYDIKLAGLEYAELLYEKYKHHRIGLTSVTDSSGSRSYFAEVPKSVLNIIESYRKKVIW